ncbi:unnamed protein product [Auanema sp. JU1783]|nr:unnamed protein product [Auanema sp. JU1783]
MTRTRSAKIDIDEDAVEMEEAIEVETGMPSPDLSVAVKLVIAPENFPGSSLVLLPHPKSAKPALFRIGEDFCDEVLLIDEGFRSTFFGDSITGDGTIRFLTPIHPLFLVIPYLYNKKDMFLELDDLFTDEDFPAMRMLLTNKQLKKSLEKVADIKDVCDTTVVRYNESKCNAWISSRFEILKTYFKECGGLHASVLEDEAALSRYVFGVLTEYLATSFVPSIREFLNIPEASECQKRMESEAPIKRKADDESLLLAEKPAKRPKESVIKKQLQQASKGTRSIGSFFAKKN